MMWFEAAWVSSTLPIRLRPGTLLTKFARHGQHRSFVACAAQTVPGDTRVATGKIWLPTAKHTRALGALLAHDIRVSDVLLLQGELGAGKTALARGYIQAARQNDSIDVTSPTYLLTNTYPPDDCEPAPRAPAIFHMDLWRLEDATKRSIVDFEKVFTQSVSLIEWPDRLKGNVPDERLDITLEYPPNNTPETNDESDPWGFGSGEPDDMGSSRNGRYALLVPRGKDWYVRVKSIHNSLSIDVDGNFVIAET